MINQHTPGPILTDDGFIRIEDQAQNLLEDVGTAREWVACGPGDEEDTTRPASVVFLAHPDNAKLLASAYNAFDKTARSLGVDATELAEKFPLESAINAWAQAHLPDMSGADFLEGWFGINKQDKSQA
jgi:hypothetical protein